MFLANREILIRSRFKMRKIMDTHKGEKETMEEKDINLFGDSWIEKAYIPHMHAV